MDKFLTRFGWLALGVFVWVIMLPLAVVCNIIGFVGGILHCKPIMKFGVAIKYIFASAMKKITEIGRDEGNDPRFEAHYDDYQNMQEQCKEEFNNL